MADEELSPPSEPQLASIDIFKGGAQAAIEESADLATGYRRLNDEYTSSQWDDPRQAADLLSQFGTVLRQKFDKNNAEGLAGPLNDQLPYSFNEIPDPTLEDPAERQIAKINVWEAANMQYLAQTPEPKYLVQRDILKKYIPEIASYERRKIKDPGLARDLSARFAEGVIAPITSLFGVESPQFLRENTNVNNDDDFLSELASGFGTVTGAIGTAAATGGTGLAAYLGAGAVGSVKNTYQDVKEQTGDTERAVEAAGIDAVGQGVGLGLGFGVGRSVGGKLTTATAEAFGLSSKALANGATEAVAKEIFKDALKNGAQFAAANVAMKVGSTAALNVGLDQDTDLTEGLARAAASGFIVGTAVSGGVEAYGHLGRRLAVRRAAEAGRGAAEPEAAPPPETPPPPGSAGGEIVSPEANTSVDFSRSSEGRDTMLRMRARYDELIKEGKTEDAQALLESAKRVAENKPIPEEPPEFYEEDLPEIDELGNAHPRGEQTLFRTPYDEEVAFAKETAPVELTTSDGGKLYVDADGKGVKARPDGQQTAKADALFFVEQPVAANVTALKNVTTPDGKTPRIKYDGDKLLVESNFVDADLQTTDVSTGDRVVEVPTIKEPRVGAVPIEVNIPSTGDGKVDFQSNVGRTITDVKMNEPTAPGGEEGAVGPEELPLKIGQRVIDNPNYPKAVRDAFMTINNQGEPVTTLSYIPRSRLFQSDKAQAWITERGGYEGAYEALMRPESRDSLNAGFAAAELFNAMSTASYEVSKAGDIATAAKLDTMMTNLLERVADVPKTAGQFIDFQKTIKSFDPEKRLFNKVSELRAAFFNDVLAEEGLRPEEHKQQELEIARAGEQIKEIEANPTDVGSGVKLTADEQSELQESTKLVDEADASIAERVETLNDRDEQQIQLGRSELDRINQEATRRVSAVDEKISRLNDIDTQQDIRGRIDDSIQRIAELEAIARGQRSEAQKAELVDTRKNLKKLERQDARIRDAREKLYLAREQQLKPPSKEAERIDRINKQITELMKGINRREANPDSVLSPKNQERIKLARDRRITLERKAAPKDKPTLSREQTKEIDRLNKRREQLQKQIEKRMQKVEERLNKNFPPEQREEYKSLIRASREVSPKSDEGEAVSRRLDKMERDLTLSKWQKRRALAYSFYVSNVLFDLGTQLATLFGNSQQFFSQSANIVFGGPFRGESVMDIPRNFTEFSRIALKSLPKATREAFDAFAHGYFNKYGEQDFARNGPPGLRLIGYSGRLLSALDKFFTTFGGDAALAIRLLETSPEAKNLSGEALRNFLDERLGGGKAQRDAALIEAARRGEYLKEAGIEITEKGINQMADDIIRRENLPNIYDENVAWKKKIALTQRPKGAIGQLIKGLDQMSEAKLGNVAVLKPFILFTRAMGNLLEYKAESTPYGFLRPSLLKASGVELTPLERSGMYTQALLGTLTLGAAAAFVQAGLGQIHGNGPSNPAQRRRWMDAGAKPYSMQIGDKYISYSESPFAPMLAGLGGWYDSQRYSKNKFGEQEAANYIFAASANSLFATPLTQNFSQFFEIMQNGMKGDDITGAVTDFFRRNVVEAGRNAILPGNRQLRNISAMWQDPLDTRLSFQAAVLNGLPFASGAGKPALNVFGEPILEGKTTADRFRSISRFYSAQVTEPAIRFLSDKGYYVSDLPYKVTISDKYAAALGSQRAKKFGNEYSSVLTESERYELQRLSGPYVREIVMGFRSSYGNQAWDERVQQKMNERISDVRSKIKMQILAR